MNTGPQRIRQAALIVAGLILLGCASSPAPETRVRGAASVAPAYYPEPGSTAEAHPIPVRATGDGDRITWVSAGEKEAPGSTRVDPETEARIFVLANQARREQGAPVLALRGDLIRIARAHAADMAQRGYFSHYTPEGLGPGARARAGGVNYGAFAENLARVRYGPDPAVLSIEGWIRSAGHRRNLFDERKVGYRYTGIGVAVAADGTVLVSQVLLR